jgi:uncharacterized membrane protein
MNRKHLGGISAVLVVAMAATGVFAAISLPADLRLPIHWDLSGMPDNWAGKWTALLMPAAMTALLSLLFWFLPRLEPRDRNLSRSQGLYLWGWASLLLIGLAIQIVLLSSAFGWGIPANRLIVGSVGLMFLIIGNQLGKSRRMFMIGLRTPWTLASEEVWIRTHRLAGKLMVLTGLIAIISAFLPIQPRLLAMTLLASIAVAAVIPIVYSYLLWRRERQAGGGRVQVDPSVAGDQPSE